MKTRNMSIPIETANKLDKYCAAKLLTENIRTSPVKVIVELVEKLKVEGVFVGMS